MAVVEHNVLTGSSVHELKGADVAAIHTVPTSDGAGATSFSLVDADTLGSDSVTTVKILDENVTEPKLADNAVSTRTIADGAVTNDKLAASAFRRVINTQTGTAYTLQLVDRTKYIRMNNASANTITIPVEGAVAFENGDQIDLIQIGAGVTTVAGGVGVTVNGVSAGSAALNAQWAGATLIKVGTDEWDLVGDHAGVA